MRYAELPPPPSLAGAIRCLWFLEADVAEEPPVERILPDGCPELVVHLGDPFRAVRDGVEAVQPRAFLVGQLTGALRLRPSRHARVAGVRFTPAGAAAFVAAPLHELTDSVAAAGALWGGRGEGLPARLADASDGDARLGVLTRHLLACQRHEATDLAVDRAVRLVQRARGGVRVRDLAAACNLSPRQLERRFRDRVGLSPKRYARVVRFRRLVARARAMPRPDWAGLAVDCGFADQPHLVREFAAFAGLPPAAHASERNVLDGLFGADVAFVQDTPP